MRSRAELTPSVALSRTALLIALASVLGYAEAVLLPALPVPGLRIGLANLAVLLAMVLLGPNRALVVSLARVLVVGLATGTLFGPAGAMSAAGAFAAWMAMALVARTPRSPFSLVGISVTGSYAHVLGQLAMASLLVGSPYPFALAPLSLAASICAGLVIGYSARLLLSRVPFMKVSFA